MDDSFQTYYDGDTNKDKPESANHSSNGLATAALLLGIVSIPLVFFFYFCIPMAATAIILALLSRGNGHMKLRCKLATLIAAISIAASAFLTVNAIYTLYNDPELLQELEQLIDYYYGIVPELDTNENPVPEFPTDMPNTVPYPIPEWTTGGEQI